MGECIDTRRWPNALSPTSMGCRGICVLQHLFRSQLCSFCEGNRAYSLGIRYIALNGFALWAPLFRHFQTQAWAHLHGLGLLTLASRGNSQIIDRMMLYPPCSLFLECVCEFVTGEGTIPHSLIFLFTKFESLWVLRGLPYHGMFS